MKFSMIRKKSNTQTAIMGLDNVNINLCNLMNGIGHSTIADLFIPSFKTCSNVIHKCPYQVRDR